MVNNPIPVVAPLEYFLHEFGIEESFSIVGTMTTLLPGRDLPIVFMIDEQHKNDICTDQNVGNALELIRKAQVSLVGVESHSGGQEWDDYEGEYKGTYDSGRKAQPINDYPNFAESIGKSYQKMVFGVECAGMLNQIQCNLSVNDNEWYGKEAQDHPLNQKRSEHFLRTLLELRSKHNMRGNLILNVGGNHNSHIEGWIKNGTIEAKAGQKAAYVRLRASAHRG